MRRTVAVVVAVGSSLAVAACSRSDGDVTDGHSGQTPTSEPSPSPESTEGGFGAQVDASSEFTVPSPRPFAGVLRLAGNGCWRLEAGDGAGMLVFPAGWRVGDDPTIMLAPDGATFVDGDPIAGRGDVVPPDVVPGGTDGRWGQYVGFCAAPDGVFVATEVRRAEPFVPTLAEAQALVTSLGPEDFTVDGRCGYGFTTSTADGRVTVRVEPDGDPPAGGPVELPSAGWRAEMVVGAPQIEDSCDDLIEWFEPVSSSELQRLPLVSGHFTMPATDSATWCTVPQRIKLEGVGVAAPEWDAPVGPFWIDNVQFGCFGG